MALELSLPPQVVSQTDIGHLLNELKQIDEIMLQLGLRSSGAPTKMPKTTRLMDLLVEHNKLNLLKNADRALLMQYLEAVRQRAPRLHFSFGADPSPAFLEKLVAWARREVNPHLLITVGLQPNIGAGCIVRSSNRQFDFSLGQTFEQKRQLLIQKLQSA